MFNIRYIMIVLLTALITTATASSALSTIGLTRTTEVSFTSDSANTAAVRIEDLTDYGFINEVGGVAQFDIARLLSRSGDYSFNKSSNFDIGTIDDTDLFKLTNNTDISVRVFLDELNYAGLELIGPEVLTPGGVGTYRFNLDTSLDEISDLVSIRAKLKITSELGDSTVPEVPATVPDSTVTDSVVEEPVVMMIATFDFAVEVSTGIPLMFTGTNTTLGDSDSVNNVTGSPNGHEEVLLGSEFADDIDMRSGERKFVYTFDGDDYVYKGSAGNDAYIDSGYGQDYIRIRTTNIERQLMLLGPDNDLVHYEFIIGNRNHYIDGGEGYDIIKIDGDIEDFRLTELENNKYKLESVDSNEFTTFPDGNFYIEFENIEFIIYYDGEHSII